MQDYTANSAPSGQVTDIDPTMRRGDGHLAKGGAVELRDRVEDQDIVGLNFLGISDNFF